VGAALTPTSPSAGEESLCDFFVAPASSRLIGCQSRRFWRITKSEGSAFSLLSLSQCGYPTFAFGGGFAFVAQGAPTPFVGGPGAFRPSTVAQPRCHPEEICTHVSMRANDTGVPNARRSCGRWGGARDLLLCAGNLQF
jgi:hypothetical protein